MMINTGAKDTLARLLAEENLVVQHDSAANTASINLQSRTMVLPAWQNMTDMIYNGLIAHEVGHARWTPGEDFVAVVKANPELQATVNIFEDARIERMIRAKFPGTQDFFRCLWKELNDRDLFGIQRKPIAKMKLIDRINLYFKSMGKVAGETFTAEERKIVDQINQAKTFEEICQIAQAFKKHIEEEQEEQKPGDEKGNGKGEKKESQPSNGNGNGEEDGNEEGEGSGEGEEKGEAQDGSNENNPASQGGGDNNPNNAKPSDVKAKAVEKELTSETLNKLQKFIVASAAKGRSCVTVRLRKLNQDNCLVPVEVIADYFKNFFGTSVYNNPHARTASTVKSCAVIADHMFNEFNAKKAADEWRRTSVAKTGKINPTKLHAYRYEDNLFMNKTIVRDGTNHGVVIFFDMSGSMAGTIGNVSIQLIILAQFCRKAGIPFAIMGFSDNAAGAKGEISGANQPWTDVRKSREGFTLRQYARNGMSTIAFNNAMHNLFNLGKDNAPHSEALGSTPLCQTAAAAMSFVPKFKAANRLQKVHTIFMTDGGESDGTSSQAWNSIDGSDDYYSYRSPAVVVDASSNLQVRNSGKSYEDMMAISGTMDALYTLLKLKLTSHDTVTHMFLADGYYMNKSTRPKNGACRLIKGTYYNQVLVDTRALRESNKGLSFEGFMNNNKGQVLSTKKIEKAFIGDANRKKALKEIATVIAAMMA